MDNAQRKRGQAFPSEQLAVGAMNFQQGILGVGMERAKKHAPKVIRVLKVARYGPGLVLDAANILTADDWKRPAAEAAGGIIGGVIGAAGGGPAAPLTGAVGSAAGSWAGGQLYDAGVEIIDDLADWQKENDRRMEETKRVNDARNAAQRHRGR
ncbi:hypothetical protein [Phenylobacterium sp.]|uniref:hypothetical protein n=1 Tax=Phenylobacterium sp. TaxID=1871053 RepID=UPI00378464A6